MQIELARIAPASLIVMSLMVTACSSIDNDDITPKDDESEALFTDGEFVERLEAIRSANELPALTAFIVQGNGAFESAAVGERSIGSGVAVTTDDRWHVGSITKSMTATLAGVLVDEGIIRWDTTIAEIFPEDADTILEKYQSIELQQLLSMTSGVKDQFDDPNLDQLDLDDETSSQRILAVPLVLSYDHELTAGEFHYANVGYVLASAMLEKATNQNWRDLLTSKVMARLNINDFGFGPPGTEGQLDQPLGHVLVDGEYRGVFADNPAILDPAGRVNMSLTDIAAYASFHLNGKSGESTLLRPEVMEELYRGRAPLGSGDLDAGDSYALGWGVIPGDDVVYHSGSNTLWLAFLGIDFRCDYAAFIATNVESQGSANAFDTVLDLIEEKIGDSCNIN